MKLYILDQENQKHYLQISALDRKDLSAKLSGSHFLINGVPYSVADVHAEPAPDPVAIGMLLGGLIGAVGGVGGVIVGGAIGGIASKPQADSERQAVERFNGSSV